MKFLFKNVYEIYKNWVIVNFNDFIVFIIGICVDDVYGMEFL